VGQLSSFARYVHLQQLPVEFQQHEVEKLSVVPKRNKYQKEKCPVIVTAMYVTKLTV